MSKVRTDQVFPRISRSLSRSSTSTPGSSAASQPSSSSRKFDRVRWRPCNPPKKTHEAPIRGTALPHRHGLRLGKLARVPLRSKSDRRRSHPGARASRPHRSGRSPAGPLCLRFSDKGADALLPPWVRAPRTGTSALSRRQWRRLASCLHKKGAGGTPALPGGTTLPGSKSRTLPNLAKGSIVSGNSKDRLRDLAIPSRITSAPWWPFLVLRVPSWITLFCLWFIPPLALPYRWGR